MEILAMLGVLLMFVLPVTLAGCASQAGPAQLPDKVPFDGRTFTRTGETITDAGNLKDSGQKFGDHVIYIPVDPIAAYNALYLTDAGDKFVLYRPPADQLVKKPNIYLYPPAPATISVRLGGEGRVVGSIPSYDGQWLVRAHPDGSIDGGYGYLFYEAAVPGGWENDAGWVVSQEEMVRFLADLLPRLGLNAGETRDFLDYWPSALPPSPYYAIYPQSRGTIERLVSMDILPRPDSLLRLWFVFEPLNEPLPDLARPAMTTFDRTGFTVVEWGGVISNSDHRPLPRGR